VVQLDGRSVAIFHSSLDRWRADPTFLDRFYTRFMGISPEIAARFEG
jgi:hypothetical protein